MRVLDFVPVRYCKALDPRIKAHGRSCSGVRNSDLIVFNVTVSIRGCSSNAVVSIGLSGVREVLALYVHPQCGCDCERPEKQVGTFSNPSLR